MLLHRRTFCCHVQHVIANSVCLYVPLDAWCPGVYQGYPGVLPPELARDHAAAAAAAAAAGMTHLAGLGGLSPGGLAYARAAMVSIVYLDTDTTVTAYINRSLYFCVYVFVFCRSSFKSYLVVLIYGQPLQWQLKTILPVYKNIQAQ